MNTDVLIVGSGCSGLYCALKLPRDIRITLITKSDLESNDSFLAQGGMCMLKEQSDFDSFFEDTLKAGHYENDRESVGIMINLSPEVVKDLVSYGADFARNDDGSLAYTREGAHSHNRIIFHEDVTGKEITSTLLAQVKKLSNVTLMEYTTMVDIIERDNKCYGAIIRKQDGTLEKVTAAYTVMACGGVVGYNMGSVYNVTLKGDSTITGNNCVGGIVGGNNNSITNCTVKGATVVVIGDNHFTDQIIQADVAECGGLVVGGSFGGSIDSCTASGTVKATGNEPVGLGGIGGCLEMMDTITNCTADVTIESENGGHAIGGLCGYAGTHSNPDICLETEGFSTKNYPSVIDNCNVTVNIKANGATHVGGLVGTGLYYYGEETVFKITNCSVKGSIDGAVTPGTVAGRAEGSTIESCTADVTIDENAGTEQVGTTTQMYESADQ